MKKLYLLLAMLYMAQQLVAQTSIIPEWVAVEYTNGSGTSKGPLIKTDMDENVIVCTETYNGGPVIGFVTIKYSPEGVQLWKKYHDTSAQDRIMDCEIGPDGSVYVLGQSYDVFTSLSRFVLYKYTPDGATAWQMYYGDTQPISSNATDLILDSDGYVYVIGRVIYIDTNDYGLMLLKINPAGEIIRDTQLTEGEFGYSTVDARLIGNLFYIWGVVGSPEGIRFVCWQVTKDGQTQALWPTEPYNDFYYNYYWIDEEGNFLVGDYCCEYRVTKFSNKGDTKWVYIKPVPPDAPLVGGRLVGIRTDAENNVYVTGPHYVNDTLGRCPLTTKLSPNGAVIWEVMPLQSYDEPENLEISSNAITVVGASPEDRNTGYPFDFFVLRMDFNGQVTTNCRVDMDGNRNNAYTSLQNDNILYVSGKGEADSLYDSNWNILAKFNLEPSGTGQVLLPWLPIEVFPNPVSHASTMRFSATDAALGLLEIHDQQGQLLRQEHVSVFSGENNLKLSIPSDWPGGIYRVSLRTPQAIYQSNIVVVF